MVKERNIYLLCFTVGHTLVQVHKGLDQSSSSAHQNPQEEGWYRHKWPDPNIR